MMKQDFKTFLAKAQEKIQKLSLKQNILTAITVGVIGFGLILVFAISNTSTEKVIANSKEEKKVEVKLGVDEVLWRGSQEDKLNDANQKLSAAAGALEEFKTKAELELAEAKASQEELKKANEELIKKVDWLTSFVEETYMQSKKPENNLTENISTETPEAKKAKQISIINVADRVSDAYSVGFIPANSFLDAVVLSGADISTATTSSGDPKPILVEITNMSDLPENFIKNFRNCRIKTASRAEIGTRRVNARLDTMTCEYVKTGRRITAQVNGYIAGEDAKEGLRSELIETNQDMLTRSLLGGIAGNLAGGGRNNNSSFMLPVMNQAPTTQKPFGEVAIGRLTDGLSAGVESSADRWSKFQLDEAEKRMPFLEMSPGRKVTVVFTEDSRLDLSKSFAARHGSNKKSSNETKKDSYFGYQNNVDNPASGKVIENDIFDN